MIDITQLLAKEYNINVLNFDLWFMFYYDKQKYTEQDLPEHVIKKYEHIYFIETYTIYNFYTDEHYLLRKLAIDTNVKEKYYIIDIHSFDSKKHILSFVTNIDVYAKFVTALCITQKINKYAPYIYFLVADKLVRFENTNPFTTSISKFKLHFATNIPFIYYEGKKNKYLVYSIFNSKYVELPFRLYHCKNKSNNLLTYNSNNRTYVQMNPFNFNMYLQYYNRNNYSPAKCIPLNVLI
jgi:hypothetical protein